MGELERHGWESERAQEFDAESNLTFQKLAAADLLARGVRLGRVAKSVGTSRENLWRWRKDSDFRREEHRRFLELQESRSRRAGLVEDLAWDTLADAMREGDTDAALAIVKLKASDRHSVAEDLPPRKIVEIELPKQSSGGSQREGLDQASDQPAGELPNSSGLEKEPDDE